ncbi:UNKNOWN [Stylonychia lemnae]|uniref:Component of oligomeric Golgi complex 7 n=1 Tax=Stylonychia lemnae TaxID=5949 RepID=A0A078A6T7_STYLE|nr:UNKNOWN [Stylonychia lemnae]|eukprot:CDW77287.1 UNKNOWN [Stylonychia lemnae]
MEIQAQLSAKDYDPIHFIRQAFALQKKKDDKPNQANLNSNDGLDEKLRLVNNLNFKLQMLSQESINLIQHSTTLINKEIETYQESNFISENLAKTQNAINDSVEGVQQSQQKNAQGSEKQVQSSQEIRCNQKINEIKSDFSMLSTIDKRINNCKIMSQEIEHFESRVAKVEEYIRLNKFSELVLLVQQLQESLKVVRDLSFFEKQKQRIEKFDKMIQAYAQNKEKEFIFECNFYKQNAENIRQLILLEQYFANDNQLVEQIMTQKLLKEFEYILLSKTEEENLDDEMDPSLVKNYKGKFFFKFSQAVKHFLSTQIDFLNELFDDTKLAQLQKDHIEKLMIKMLADYKDKLIQEFVHSLDYDQQLEVYENFFIKMLVNVRTIIGNRVAVSLDQSFNLFFKDLYQEMLDKYRKQIDIVASENFQYILEKDALGGWEKNFLAVTHVFEKVLVNNVHICQCYELQFLAQTVLKTLEKFLMQIRFHIGQFCNKRIHMGIPNPNTSNQAVPLDDQQQLVFEQKFKWQSIFDMILLHQQKLIFFDKLKQLDDTLILTLEKLACLFEQDSQQKKISAFIAVKNTVYLKQLQKYLSPQSKQILFTIDSASGKSIDERIFRQELTGESSIVQNLLRAFIMPIFKELNNISIFPLWKQASNSGIQINQKQTQKQQMSILLPESSEYIRKIGEHFISFIHKLDSSQITATLDKTLNLYQIYSYDLHASNQHHTIQSASEYWIGEIGKYLVSTLSNKYMKINILSADGERQLIADIIYIKKLLSQFCNPHTLISPDDGKGIFEIMDSIVIGLVANKKLASDSSISEIIDQISEELNQVFGIGNLDKIHPNENIIKAIQIKRK